MNDDDRKRLTEFIGECWHEYDLSVSPHCLKCPNPFYGGYKKRIFNNWPDLGAVKERLVSEKKWRAFIRYTEMEFNIMMCDFPNVLITDFDDWLFRPTVDGKPHFCQLVANFLKEREEK